ncbi:class I SAM-dependent methyltransferase [Stackebrandtia albiflava]|nr:class I SAM-dependent methyltransferase [Stackebrandtia albiflava]
MNATRLDNPEGHALVATATRLLTERPDRAAVALRRHTDDPELAQAAMNQATLRAAAYPKFGPDTARMFFTRDGLEQASRAVVAERRADRLAAAGADRVADLCCGIGADAFAMARHGLTVVAVDSDAETADIARANAAALGLSGQVEVRHERAQDTDLTGVDAAFADPARRHAGRRIFDPRMYSPPLPELWRLTEDVDHRVCKVGPGIDHSIIPPDAEAEWVSVDGDVVEAALWRGGVATAPRRASVITGRRVTELTGPGDRQATVGEIGGFLYEPDGAVIRAHLVAELAELVAGRLAHPKIAYLYTDAIHPTPLATGYRIDEVLPFHVKKLRQLVAARRIGRLTVKKRGADVEPDRLRRELKPAGDNEATLIVTRIGERHTALLCERLPS